MARELQLSTSHARRALQTAARLQPFVLSGVTQTGRKLGEGAYGCVEELSISGLICAGKRMYDTLVDPENEGADRMIEKYFDECQLLSSVRHPNIVQFLGICFLDSQSASTAALPVLVMEMMQGSLDDLLENTPDIPLAKKVSILQDVARGLVYLHGCSPAVIHRDLTARNVLLNSAMVAKIADMGNSRMVDVQPGQLARSMTRGVPGTAVYMPPEAFELPPKYGPKLDMFSFGHLALFTATQQFPGDLLPSTYQDPHSRQIKGRNEVERRSRYMEGLVGMLGRTHELVQLVTQCLDYAASARPTASEAMDRLQHISSTIHDLHHSMSRLQLEKALNQSETKRQMSESILLQGSEVLESGLLTKIKELNGVMTKQPRALTGEQYVDVRGLTYTLEWGGLAGNIEKYMIMVSVGDEYPADLVVQKRKKNRSAAEKSANTYGSLPWKIPGLHEEAAADLMATVSTLMKCSAGTVVQLLLDIPTMQRSKQFYLSKIETFLQNCQGYAAVVRYMGNSERDTGNWCFKDGTISFQEIFSIYRRHPSIKRIDIQTDCNYSGQWVRECAKTLDSLHIPPCGHRARERGAMVRIFASCQADQEAAEPGYSIEAMTVKDDGSITISSKQMTHQKSIKFNSTKLVCCRGPDSPCPQTTFQHLTWENAVDDSINLWLFRRREGDRDMWYYLILHQAGDAYNEEFRSQQQRDPSLRLSDWSYVLESGEGERPPQAVTDKVQRWACIELVYCILPLYQQK